MPLGDRRGPSGLGPMTGRRMGLCSGFGVPGYLNRAGSWLGFGGRGSGRGHRHWFYATGLTGWQRNTSNSPSMTGYEVSPEDEAAILRQNSDFYQNHLEAIHKRLSELEKRNGQS